jgi:mannose/fructose/N-acetylgalactosamine-specific phosphotransferase system component IIC
MIFLLSVLGGIVLLDKQAIGEFGVSQPIVVCPLIGFIFGEFSTGFLFGSVMQLIWAGALPLGSKEPIDNQGAGVVAISLFILANTMPIHIVHEKMIFTCLFFGGIASLIGQSLSQVQKKLNNKLFCRIDKNSADKLIITSHFTGLITAFLRGFMLIILLSMLFVIIYPLTKLLPAFSVGELLIIPLIIGIASIARLLILRKRILYSTLGAVTGLLLWVLLKL